MYKKILLVIILIFVSACSAVAGTPTQTPIPTLTSTPFVPLSKGTPLPLIYQPIEPETASSVTLLAHWNEGAGMTKRLAFMQNGDELLLDDKLWHVQDGTLDRVLKQYPLEVNNSSPLISYAPDSGLVVETYIGDVISFISIRDRKFPKNGYLVYYIDNIGGKTVSPDKRDNAIGTTFSLDSRYLVILRNTGRIWFVPTDDLVSHILQIEDATSSYGSSDLRPKLMIDVGKTPEEIVFSQNGNVMAIATKDNAVQIWDVPSLSYRLTIKDVDKASNLVFSPDGKIIAVGLKDHQIHLWETESGQPLTQLQGHKGHLKSLAFSPTGLLLASVDDKDGVLLWGIPPRSNSPSAAKTTTAIAQYSSSSTPMAFLLPTPSPLPTSAIPLYSTLFWPVTAPTDAQLDEVRSCDIEKLGKIRYPEALDYWQIGKAYTPHSACDWATMAVAYQNRWEDKKSISEDGKRAFYQAFKLNPAFALQTEIYYNYFNSVNLVSVPRIVQQPIQSLAIDYNWSGMGEPSSVGYHIKIEQANMPEKMKILIQTKPNESKRRGEKKIDANLVQAIAPAMVNLIPVRSPFNLNYCTDTSPDWTAQVTFLDGTVLLLNTNGSNLLTAGGPWHVQIGVKHYTQFSTHLLGAFLDLFDALDLPLGQPMSMFCASTDIFNLAYP